MPHGLLGQLVRFGGVGALSRCAYQVPYLGLREVTGPQRANRCALVITAVANTAANRRLTFGLEITVLVLANAVSTLVRFLSLRQLMGRRPARE